jgi:hypothetical protein
MYRVGQKCLTNFKILLKILSCQEKCEANFYFMVAYMKFVVLQHDRAPPCWGKFSATVHMKYSRIVSLAYPISRLHTSRLLSVGSC